MLALGFAVQNVGSTWGSLLRALGYSRQIAFNAGTAAAINVVLNLLLIPGFEPLGVPKLGILGAAIATVASHATLDLLMGAELYLALGRIPLSRVILGPLAIALVLFAGLFVIHDSIPGTLLWMVATAGASAVVYWSAVLSIQGFNDEDVLIIKSTQEIYNLEHLMIDRLLRRFD